MLKLQFKPFDFFIQHYTTQMVRNKFKDVRIDKIDVQPGHITANVQELKYYQVEIEFNAETIQRAYCSCMYEKEGYCTHIVKTMIAADGILADQPNTAELKLTRTTHYFKLATTEITALNEEKITAITVSAPKRNWFASPTVQSAKIFPNRLLAVIDANVEEHAVEVKLENNAILLHCDCENLSKKLCNHLSTMLAELQYNKHLQLAFSDVEREVVLQKQAKKMGLESLQNLEDFFQMEWNNGRFYIEAKHKLLNINENIAQTLQAKYIPQFQFPTTTHAENTRTFLLISENQYSERVNIELTQAPLTQAGVLKSPFTKVSIQPLIQQSTSLPTIQFYAALLQQEILEQTSVKDELITFQKIIANPQNYTSYFSFQQTFQPKKKSPKEVEKIQLEEATCTAQITVDQQQEFYVVRLTIHINNTPYSSGNVQLIGHYFFMNGNTLYLINNEAILSILTFFKDQQHELFIHKQHFSSFQDDFLYKLDSNILVSYTFVQPAPKKGVKSASLKTISDHFIYLSEQEDYILITPVIAYGEMEVPVRSKRAVYGENPAGGLYQVQRNEKAELNFLLSVEAQHPDFNEDNGQLFYYLHKQAFLHDFWYLNTFEKWRSLGYTILGFNQLTNNKLNAHKIKVTQRIHAGLDWFDVETVVQFGKQAVRLKEIQKALHNKRRFVELGDGTEGILPEEWIQKFSAYFRTAELKDDHLKIHRSNFQFIDELFDASEMDEQVIQDLASYQEKLANFTSIQAVKTPAKLMGSLRSYQLDGLNWLNFLDEFGFGGCLADDMGLGKTIQIIAYILSQHEKGNLAPTLIVVPTSLLFNWQAELDKFAPSLSYHIIHGTKRKEVLASILPESIYITTYGTLLSEIETLQSHFFNCVILDESQSIKNPHSKRYKAAQLLKSRQRLVLTGTPVENNTFDLYAQLSFVMPGLLGTLKNFTDNYASPIDKFQDTARARELQRKIHPFVLRRTKNQVAKELPEKTEMVIYCEMGTEQQRIYDTYKEEFQRYLKGIDDREYERSSLHVLQGLTKLRQICNSPALLSDEAFYGDNSAKIEVLLSQIASLVPQHKILVFSQFVTMLELVKKELDQSEIPYAYLTGQTKDRQAQVELFQEDPNINVFLISLKAGGTGLNLTQASYVFLIDPWWNPAVENQAIDRAHRIGQDNKVIAVRLITPGTIEEKIRVLQDRKKELVQDIIHTDFSIGKELNKNELLNLL